MGVKESWYTLRMVRIAFFQPFSGASGDMALGAMVDAGLSVKELEEGLRSLDVGGWQLEVSKVVRGAFASTRLKVILKSSLDHHHHHHHEHAHHHHSHDTGDSESRNLQKILDLIGKSGLPKDVKESASRVFRRLGEAEAKMHGIPVDRVHFHEVGAVDSIVDIVGACLGLHLLGVNEVHSSPIVVGTGFVRAAHGKIPLPAPATLELLRGFPVEQIDSQAELTTPTGAALLTTLSKNFGTIPPMQVLAAGYGAGDDRPGPVPNMLRLVLGEAKGEVLKGDRVVVLETNIDDMSPEWTGNLMERLFEAGALDVTATAVLMKKSRPAQEIKVVAPLSGEAKVLQTLFRESTTFGLRRTETNRVILEREMRTVETPWGPVKVKVGRLGTEVITTSPEYEDLRTASAKAGLPLKEVHQRVLELLARK